MTSHLETEYQMIQHIVSIVIHQTLSKVNFELKWTLVQERLFLGFRLVTVVQPSLMVGVGLVAQARLDG
jgi:hypothetical protein